MSLGALFALWVVGLVVAPRSSLADCSHPERPGFAVSLDGDLGREQDRPFTPSKPKPCSGPQCSGKSAPSPSSTAIPKVSVFDEAWAWVGSLVGDDEARSTPLGLEDSVICPACNPSSIFHPPRRSR